MWLITMLNELSSEEVVLNDFVHIELLLYSVFENVVFFKLIPFLMDMIKCKIFCLLVIHPNYQLFVILKCD